MKQEINWIDVKTELMPKCEDIFVFNGTDVAILNCYLVDPRPNHDPYLSLAVPNFIFGHDCEVMDEFNIEKITHWAKITPPKTN